MIADCREAGLPEPDFEQHGPHFVVTILRDWLTEEVMTSLDLSARQQQAVQHVKVKGRNGNSEYQEIASIAKRTAHRDLADLVAKGVFIKIGTRGKGTFYKVRRNRAINGPKGNFIPATLT